jgi:hypothetical protein
MLYIAFSHPAAADYKVTHLLPRHKATNYQYRIKSAAEPVPFGEKCRAPYRSWQCAPNCRSPFFAFVLLLGHWLFRREKMRRRFRSPH